MSERITEYIVSEEVNRFSAIKCHVDTQLFKKGLGIMDRGIAGPGLSVCC